jgi:dTDP-4-dehydrorhamnose reductase
MKTILITGANGQLGCCLQDIATQYSESFQFLFTDIEEMDISKFDSVYNFCTKQKVDIIINAAAYTQVDLAEQEIELVHLINCEGVSNIVEVCKKLSIFLVHISTDYIFDGTFNGAYTEEMIPNPISVYGKSKWEGESKVLESGISSIIIRTSWLYSEYGKNFLKTILKLTKEKEDIQVVSDQTGTPTYAGDLAEVVMKCIEKRDQVLKPEIFHFSNSGVSNWYAFALLITKISGANCKITPISEKDYPTNAKRPKNSLFSKEKLKKFLNIEIANWEESVQKCLKKLV